MNLWFNGKKEGQKVPYLMTADLQAAHMGANQTLWARLRALEESDVMVGAEVKHGLGKLVTELAYTWKADWNDEKSKDVHGLLGVPLHLRMAHNWKLADGVVYDSVQSLGKKFLTREKVDFQVSPTTKVSVAAVCDLKQTFSSPSTMLQKAAVNLEVKL